MISYTVRPKLPPDTWEDYLVTAPPYSIAIDGAVCAGPRHDYSIPLLCLNHHEDCDRGATLATCQQGQHKIRMGLFKGPFRNENGDPTANIDARDCDHDVALTTWQLLNHERCEPAMNQLINALVAVIGTLDATAGAYPYPDTLELMRKADWIFDPYMRFRLSGEIDELDGDAYRAVIENICLRIDAYVAGRAQIIVVNKRYDVLQVEDGWKMVHEIGTGARRRLFADGIDAFLSVRQRQDGSHTVSVCRRSDSVNDFEVPYIIQALNEEEGLTTSRDRWGGSDTASGSPRVGGTHLSIPQMTKVVNRCVQETRAKIASRRQERSSRIILAR